MKDDEALKNLIFFANPLPEMEEDDDDYDIGDKVALFKCDCLNILDNMGESDFKYIYQNAIITIKESNIDEQIDFCYQIIEKIGEVYGFEFIRKLDIGENDIVYVYKLLEFIEFDNVDILVDLLEGFVIDLRKVDVKQFIIDNWKDLQKCLSEMELPELIADFLRTNNKENIIDFLSKAIEKSKIELTIRLLK